MTGPDPKTRDGFTLLELVAVVAILALLAVFAVVRTDGLSARARQVAAERDLATIRDAFLDSERGYLADMRGLPGFSLAYLRIANLLIATNLYGEVADAADGLRGFRVDDRMEALSDGRVRLGCARCLDFVSWSEERQRGWRGPYVKAALGTFPRNLQMGFYPEADGLRLPAAYLVNRTTCSPYGFYGEPAVMDPWGNPYVLQIPPAQAFKGIATNVSDVLRFHYARLVSAGPNRRLETPCFAVNRTNDWRAADADWQDERQRRISRQAGLVDGTDRSLRGDDLVLFLSRNDSDEGEESGL